MGLGRGWGGGGGEGGGSISYNMTIARLSYNMAGPTTSYYNSIAVLGEFPHVTWAALFLQVWFRHRLALWRRKQGLPANFVSVKQ